uniref:TPR_REGION domain-containing protein n=1 Tax=Brugia timori TaxID=42155 RepID=A0A0R3QYY0_9BILA
LDLRFTYYSTVYGMLSFYKSEVYKRTKQDHAQRPFRFWISKWDLSSIENYTTKCIWRIDCFKIMKNYAAKKKQMDINFQQNQQTISIREQNGANSRLRSIQSDCVDLYYYWLNELLCMEIPYDKCAFALHQLMTGNCHWFLAKYGHMRLRASINYSNSKIHYDQAIISYQISIDLIENNLPKY